MEESVSSWSTRTDSKENIRYINWWEFRVSLGWKKKTTSEE